MAQTILITGATGTVGGEVLRQLSMVDQNVNIRAGGHSLGKLEKIKNDNGIKPMQIDFYKPDTLKEALNTADRVFLLTPFQADMVQLSSNMITAIKNAGDTKQIVKLSTLGADFESGGRLHRQVEKMIEDSGIAYTILRPNAFMQNFVNFYSHVIKEQGALPLPAGDGKVSFVDVHDIAAVAVQVLINNTDGRHDSKTYDITGPEAISYSDAVRILSDQVGRNLSYVNVSKEDTFKAMNKMGLDDWLINTILDGYDNLKRGLFSHVTNMVEELTGRKPISFNEFAKNNAKVFR